MTPPLRLLSNTAKMVLKRSSALFLGLIVIAIWPSMVFSEQLAASPLYNYIVSGVERLEIRPVKRETSYMRPPTKEDVRMATEGAESDVHRLRNYESILHGRHLVAEEGTPSHTALLMSWPDDGALDLAKKGFISAKASYLLSHKLCRSLKHQNFCGAQLSKEFKTSLSQQSSCSKSLFRTYNGTCNNENHPSWGSAFSAYSRLLPPNYRDGIWEPKEKISMPKNNAIEISEAVLKETYVPLKDITLASASWASLVAYDMSHTVTNRMFSNGDPVMCCEGTVWKLAPRNRHPMCMPVVNTAESKCYNYVRSMISPSEDYSYGPAQQMNAASHFLDGSGIYGTTEEVSNSLRTGNEGQIKIANVNGHQSLPLLFSPVSRTSIVSGEIRLNTDVISAVLHTILVNEHNRIASKLADLNKQWDDERLYQEARRIVIAELQHITYSEWLPLILGEKEVSKRSLHVLKSGYAGVYNNNVRPTVSNSFANAAMRFIVSLLDEQLYLYDESRTPLGNITLRYNMVDPKILSDENQLNSLIRSLATQNCQANDLALSEAVTKYLYSKSNDTGFDVLSLDIQRGRDHGLPSYTAFRKMFGLRYETFDDLTSSIPKEIVNTLKKVYDKVSSIDLIVGGLAETPKRNSLLGPVFSNIIAQQMVTTRIGDRYFYDNKDQPYPFTLDQLSEIRKVTLASLLCDNSSVKKMQPNAFLKPDLSGNKLVSCKDEETIKRLNLNLWKQ